ncbi:MAG: hypothetical protein N2C12_03960, partial [Planctomycetales bacterium]
LSLDVNAAWQILHGALPFGMRFQVRNGDETIPAMQWVLEGNEMSGWTLNHGEKKLPSHGTDALPSGRQGLKLVLEGGSNTGQGHEDQWLAVMSQCGLKLDQPIVFLGQTYQLRDIVSQSMWDVYEGKECSWTLIALANYLDDYDKEWTVSDGSKWTIEKLIAMEADQDLGDSACGGTHRLIGMTMALDNHLEKGGEIRDGWKTAEEKIGGAIETAFAMQNLDDGSFSTNYFDRPGASPDLAKRIGTTGHTLEFLSLALDKDQLADPRMEHAAVHLCDLFEATKPTNLECGALYHAAHGLIEYRERRWGPWTYPDAEKETKGTATPSQPSDAADVGEPKNGNKT